MITFQRDGSQVFEPWVRGLKNVYLKRTKKEFTMTRFPEQMLKEKGSQGSRVRKMPI